MCDEFTAADDDSALAAKRLTRREFAAMGTAAALAGYSSLSAASTSAMTESDVMVTTADGQCDAFFVAPAQGKYPGVILWPDALGLRDSKKAMARRLAAQGYAVLVVNPYYRDVRAPLPLDFAAFRTPEGRAKIMPYMQSLTPEKVISDAIAHVAFLDKQTMVDARRGIGVHGYCMGGAIAVRSAAAVPVRVTAVGSFHGGGLVTDKPDSPHRLLDKTQASYLIAIARNDDEKAPQDKVTFKSAAKAAKRPAEIEVYAGNHGWCVPDAPDYDQAAAERAWRQLLLLYKTL
ncbi:dienelactone hydrolase family protein [soil metagenome]